MPDFDKSKPSSYLTCWDANNLYGWAMCQYLPYAGFHWLSEQEIELLDVLSDVSEEEYFLEVDIAYPTSLHDKHKDLPFFPETIRSPSTK